LGVDLLGRNDEFIHYAVFVETALSDNFDGISVFQCGDAFEDSAIFILFPEFRTGMSEDKRIPFGSWIRCGGIFHYSAHQFRIEISLRKICNTGIFAFYDRHIQSKRRDNDLVDWRKRIERERI
jgi:hypothetical protein